MNRSWMVIVILGLALSWGVAQEDQEGESGAQWIQWYSGKIGYYQPRDGLNNGLLIGVDGITELTRYRLYISGTLDAYIKQSIDIFHDPKPDIKSQQIILFPLHVNAGYKIFSFDEIGCKGYIGGGGGYYFYFYSVEYQEQPGILPTWSTRLESKNGGNLFGTVSARFVLGKVFLEPRYYFASKSEKSLGGYSLTVNPSGFAISFGFQQ